MPKPFKFTKSSAAKQEKDRLFEDKRKSAYLEVQKFKTVTIERKRIVQRAAEAVAAVVKKIDPITKAQFATEPSSQNPCSIFDDRSSCVDSPRRMNPGIGAMTTIEL